jgi:hypothetical protein
MGHNLSSAQRRSVILGGLASLTLPMASAWAQSPADMSQHVAADSGAQKNVMSLPEQALGQRLVVSGRLLSKSGDALAGYEISLAHGGAPTVSDADGRFYLITTAPQQLECRVHDPSGSALQAKLLHASSLNQAGLAWCSSLSLQA